MNRSAAQRSFLLLITLISFSFLYVGCGGSEEAMAEDEMVTDTGVTEETPTEEQPMEEEQAEEMPAEEQPAQEQLMEQQEAQPVETQPTVTEQPVQQPEGPTREQLQADLDALKTENIQLKEQLSTSEQLNRDLSTKVSDLEAANMALKNTESRQPATGRPAIAGKSSAEEIRAYEQAVEKFNGKNYRDVISEMQTLLNTGIKDDYADNCHYWMGLSYYQLKEYSTAIDHLKPVLNYRFSEKKDDAQIIIAQAYAKLGDREKALTEYKKLIDMYPTSEYVGRARARLR